MRSSYVFAVMLAAALMAAVCGCALPGQSDPAGVGGGDIVPPNGAGAADDFEAGPDSGSTEPCLPDPDPDPAQYPGEGALAYFGKTMDEIRAELGEPDDQGYHEGSEYFAYDKKGIYLFFWSVTNGETVVRGITLLEGKAVAGIRVGDTFAQIKAALGEPVYEGYSGYDDSYSLICDYGHFRLFFYAGSENGPTTSVLIKYADEC